MKHVRHLTRSPFATAILSGVCALCPSSAAAEVVMDGRLGPAGPRLGPNYLVPDSLGKTRGSNLYHSFSKLSIGTNESLTFTATPGAPINRVFARVTGGERSTIDGLLRCSISSADLYLINPAGVMFGPQGQLDIGGSFFATSADHVKFSDGNLFSVAGDTAADAVLTTAPPAAFGFLHASPATISVTGDSSSPGLSVTVGREIALIGGNVTLTGGRLRTTGGRVTLRASGPGEVPVDSNTITPALAQGAGTITVEAGAEVTAPLGGTIVIRGGRLQVDRATLTSNTDVVSGGGIDVGVAGDLSLTHAGLSAETSGDAAGGSIRLRGGAVSIRGLSPAGLAPVSTNASGTGAGGSIEIDAGTLRVDQNAALSAFTAGAGRGGDINVRSAADAIFDGAGSDVLIGLAAETLRNSTGRSGDVSITSGTQITVQSGAEITSTTRGAGRAGDITRTAPNIVIDGKNVPTLTGIQARVGALDEGSGGATGNGGTVRVTASKQLLMRDGGVISASTFGQGVGGDINVSAGDVSITGSPQTEFTGLFARSADVSNTAGSAGTIGVTARRLQLSGSGGGISAQSDGGAPAGDVQIDVRGPVRLDESAALSIRAGQDGPGGLIADAGELSVKAKTVDLRSSSTIAADATGNSGRVLVIADGRIRVRDSSIRADAGLEGGQVELKSKAAVLQRSLINGLANTQNGGRDVRVIVNSPGFLQNESQILTDTLVLPPEVDIAGSISRLPGGLAIPGAALQPSCIQRLNTATSSFIARGAGGLPLQPGEWTPSPDIPE